MQIRKITYYFSLLFVALINGTITSIPGLGSIARIAVIPVFIFWIVGIRYGQGIRRPHWYQWFVLVFVFWNVLSYFWTSNDSDTIDSLSRYIPIIVVTSILWDIYRTRSQVIVALQAYVLGAYIVCISTIYGYFTNISGTDITGRYSGIGFHPDDFVYLLAVPIAWELAIRDDIKSKFLKSLNTIYPIISIITIVMTETRGAIFVAVPAYLSIIIGIRRAKPAIKIGLAASAAILILILSSGQYSHGFERITSVQGSSDAATLNGRIYLWRGAIDLMGKYPILGIGAGSFHSIASFYPGVQYTEEGLPTHNTYLSVFSELGAIGFILYTAALAAIIAIARRTESGFRIAYLSSITAFLIGSSSLTYEMRSQQWLLFVLILVHCHAINSNQTLTIRRNAILAKKANNLIEAPIT